MRAGSATAETVAVAARSAADANAAVEALDTQKSDLHLAWHRLLLCRST